MPSRVGLGREVLPAQHSIPQWLVRVSLAHVTKAGGPLSSVPRKGEWIVEEIGIEIFIRTVLVLLGGIGSVI